MSDYCKNCVGVTNPDLCTLETGADGVDYCCPTWGQERDGQRCAGYPQTITSTTTAPMSEFMRVVAGHHGSNNARNTWSDFTTYIHAKCPDCDRLTAERDEWEAIARVMAEGLDGMTTGDEPMNADEWLAWAREQVVK